jgi:nucleotide-binding universal stress UspA family protein
MYQRILVPLDGSVTSTRALDEAVKLARLTGGRLRLLHVSDVLTFATGFETHALYTADVLPTMKRAGAHILDEGRVQARSRGVDVDSVLTESVGPSVAEVVADQALQWHADLIVIGTHGRRGAARLLMGSDAEQIARRMPVPVLLVRSAQDRHAGAAAGASVVAASRQPVQTPPLEREAPVDAREGVDDGEQRELRRQEIEPRAGADHLGVDVA